MSESLQLRLQHHDQDMGTYCDPQTVTARLVTGVELADGSSLRSELYNPNLPEAPMPLAWPTGMAENVFEYYGDYMMHPDRQDQGWNCHSFVASVMGWQMLWNEDATPHYMPHRPWSTGSERLKDHTPYAIKNPLLQGIQHSVMGLPDPIVNLGVWGFRNNLLVISNDVTVKFHGGKIYRHRAPHAPDLNSADPGLRATLPPQLSSPSLRTPTKSPGA
jgi:hypothetical protein